MKTALNQSQFKPFSYRSQAFMANIRLISLLSAGLTATSLLMVTPAFGQTPQSMAFEQQPYTGKVSEPVELTPVARTALLNPELDQKISSVLIWTFYISFPVSVIAAIWWYDRRAREQLVKLVQQVTTLERIWRQPQG